MTDSAVSKEEYREKPMTDPDKPTHYIGWTVSKEDILNEIREYGPPSAFRDSDSLHLQFTGWALVLLDNGKWFLEDTSGG